jgi:uncharacterized protein YndB with AHSA1/START domain
MIEDIAQSIEIAASPARVWEVLTGEGLVDSWLGCMGYKAEPGTIFYMQQDAAKREAGDISGATHCELLALDPPRRMTFSWYYPGMPKTEVSISLEPAGGATRVALVHSGWHQYDGDQIKAIRDALAGGWGSYVLPQLKRVAEG